MDPIPKASSIAWASPKSVCRVFAAALAIATSLLSSI